MERLKQFHAVRLTYEPFPVILVLDTGIHLESSWIPDQVGNDEITHDNVY